MCSCGASALPNSGVDMDVKIAQQMTPLEKSLAATVGGAMIAAGVAMGTLVGSPASADEGVAPESNVPGTQGSSVAGGSPQAGSVTVNLVSTSAGWDRELYVRAAEIEQASQKSQKKAGKKKAGKPKKQSAKNNRSDSQQSRDVKAGPPASPGSQEELVWQLLIAEGFSPAAAAGILGNLQQESNIDPTAVQADGPGMGLAQWSRGGRWDSGPNSLLAFAKERGIDPWSTETQTKFMIYEMQYGDLGFDLARYKNSTDAVSAAVYFHDVFERSADTAGHVTNVRGGYAQDWLERLG